MGQPGKVSGRGGWKQTHYLFGETRVLNKVEKPQFEKYQDYCQRVCDYPGAPDHLWYVINQSISVRSL